MTNSVLGPIKSAPTPGLNRAEPPEDAPTNERSSWWRRFLSSPGLAYGLLLILQLKVMWKIWEYKDLTPDDTSYYYWFSHTLLHEGIFTFAWAPLYQLFCAALMYISSDPLFWCISQRLICVCTLSLLVLAVMRRLIKSPVSWLVAAWFAVLPINFDSLYTGHIFFAIPHVIAWLAVLQYPGRWGRGICMATFLIATCLLRTEVVITVALFAAVIVLFEVWTHLARPRELLSKCVLLPYVLPCSIALLVVLGVYCRSAVQFPELTAHFWARHVLNIGQIYAYGHQQRHPEWTKSPWTDYGELMQPAFGAGNVTLVEAVKNNPAAVSEHLFWNLSLVPSGLQLMLFNCTSGSMSPDYEEVPCKPRLAVPLSWLAIFVSIAGAWVIYRERKEFLFPWLRQNSWALIAMASSCALCVVLMLTQRPRPSYLFPLAITLMGFYGLSFWRILRVPLTHRLGRFALSLLPVALIVVAPCFYVRHHAQGRPLLTYCFFLKPFAGQISVSKKSIIVPAYSFELMAYIYGNGNGPFKNACIPHDDRSHDQYSKSYLDANNVGWILLDDKTIKPMNGVLDSAQGSGWHAVALRDNPGERLVLYTNRKILAER